MLMALNAAARPAPMFVIKKSRPRKNALSTADFQFQRWSRLTIGCRIIPATASHTVFELVNNIRSCNGGTDMRRYRLPRSAQPEAVVVSAIYLLEDFIPRRCAGQHSCSLAHLL